MSKILKNTTASEVFVSDLGVLIPASGQLTIDPQSYLLLRASSDIIVLVADGTVVINDGSYDLSISEGIDLIKGLASKAADTTKVERDYVESIEINLMLHKILNQLEIMTLHLEVVSDLEEVETEPGSTKL